MTTPTVASASRPCGSKLSPPVASTSTEHGISCLEAIKSILLVRKCKSFEYKKQNSDLLTESERKATRREKALGKLENSGNGKTNNKKFEKTEVKETCQLVILK